MIAKIQKIDLEALFFRILKIPMVKKINLLVKILQKFFLKILQRTIFKFGHVTTFFDYASMGSNKGVLPFTEACVMNSNNWQRQQIHEQKAAV